MKVFDLFSGIGGFSLGLEKAGMKTIAFCEIDKYCQKVLMKHWPDVPIYEDVRDVTKKRLESDGITGIDVITGGFPCQDISVAGKQAGIEGDRSGLWSELARIISDIRPRYAIVENVTALLSGDRGRWFGRVLGNLAEIGYDCEWHCIPASELGAHHHRDRVWIICYPQYLRRDAAEVRESIEERNGGNEERKESASESEGSSNTNDVAHACCNRLEAYPDDGSIREPGNSIMRYGIMQKMSVWDSTAPPFTSFCGMVDGVPNRVDRLRGLGNAVVPQIPELIGRAILKYESNT